MSQQLVEGWTERVETQLLADGAPLDLTGYGVPPTSIVMQLFGRDGKLVAFQGTTGIELGEETSGIVYFDPAASDLRASLSPYSVRWKVTDYFGQIVFFPNGDPEVWVVSSPSGA